MKGFQRYDMQTQGVQTCPDGSPNTRALGRHLIILENRFNELASDVNLMQDRRREIIAALEVLAARAARPTRARRGKRRCAGCSADGG